MEGSGDEDDGFLVSVVHDELSNLSETVVIDARTMEAVCRVPMPERVPYGFHAYWTRGEEMQ
jgi:carotenoid cleavage dioxygenase